MNLVELITKYQTDATPEQMVQVTKIIGKFVEIGRASCRERV